MELRIRLIWIWAALAGIILLAGARTVWRAHRNQVTLNVRDMEVRKVARKVEWQTWERVVVAGDVQGKVTLNVRNAPLDVVLEMIAAQVSARPSHIYPVYRKRAALHDLQALLSQGREQWAAAQRWTNFSAGGGGGPGFFRGGGFQASVRTNSLINLTFQDRDPSLAAVTLSAATHAQVVPEDGIEQNLNLEIKDAARDKAIQQFASALHRKWDEFYTLQAAHFGAARASAEIDSDLMRERMAARAAALSAEQRARMEEMRNMSPEERQARMQARMEDPAAQQRMIDRTLNNIRMSTPEEIVQRKRQRIEMMQNFQQAAATPGNSPVRPPLP